LQYYVKNMLKTPSFKIKKGVFKLSIIW